MKGDLHIMFLKGLSDIFQRKRKPLIKPSNIIRLLDKNPIGYGKSDKTKIVDNTLEECRKIVNSETYNNDVKVNVTVRRRLQSDIFAASDTLFIVNFSNNGDKNPTLLSVCLSIYRSLVEIVEQLKTHFAKTCQERFCFLSIHSDHMTNDIFLGMRDLVNDSNIPDALMNVVVNYLMSHTSLSLKSGLSIRCVVVGAKHHNHILLKRKTQIKIGGIKGLKNYNLLKSNRCKTFFPITSGYSGNENCFEDSCLIVSLAVGVLFNDTHKKDPTGGQLWQTIQRFHGKHVTKCRIAGKIILQKAQDLCNVAAVPYKGPHTFDDIIPIMEKNNIQLNVFSRNDGNRLIYRYPVDYDCTRQPINLFYIMSICGKYSHTHFIKNTYGFYRAMNAPCLACTKPKSSYYSHRCTKNPSCSKCGMLQLKSTTYINTAYTNMMCNSLVSKDEKLHCNICNRDFKTQKCYKAHFKHSCKNVWVCPICDIIYRKVGNNGINFDNIADQHKCGDDHCRICYQIVAHELLKDHICNLKPPSLQDFYTRICIFDAETLLLPNGNHSINVISCHYESKIHGNWNEVIFIDDRMKFEGDCFSQNIAEDKYLPTDVDQNICNSKKKTRYGFKSLTANKRSNSPVRKSVKKRRNGDNDEDSLADDDLLTNQQEQEQQEQEQEQEMITEHDEEFLSNITLDDKDDNGWFENKMDQTKSEKTTFTPVQKFLKFFIKDEFRGSTFISHNGSRFDSQLILSGLLSLGWLPNSVLNGSALMCLEVYEYNIRFVDSLHWLSGKLSNLPKRFPSIQEVKGIFPFQFNIEENFNYIGDPPNLKYFMSENDTDSEKSEKISFHRDYVKSGKQYNFNNEIIKYCCADTALLRQAITAFLKESFEFQRILTDRYGHHNESEKMKYFHAMSFPFFTVSSYVYTCFRHFCLNHKKQFSIIDEKGLSRVISSQGEMVYVTFLEKSHKNIIHGFNSTQQKKFGKITPDAYCPDCVTAFFFHGCHIHGHLEEREKCPYMNRTDTDESTNCFKKTFGELRKNFQRQKDYLMSDFASEVKKVSVIYQCVWEKKVKDISTAEYEFIMSEYKSRPVKRMAIRDCLRGGRTECFQVRYDNNDTRRFYYKVCK
jgi:G:T-mismatch repair DNA endonuclease (very short patch repair protein)